MCVSMQRPSIGAGARSPTVSKAASKFIPRVPKSFTLSTPPPLQAARLMTQQICWLSVDPVRRKVDFYPRPISTRIEKSYMERDPWTPSTCILGSDFFNATVHFHPSGSCYQTTPGMSMGRAGFKQPGYRSVQRCVRVPGQDRVLVHSKQVHGEWRIAATEAESDVQFEEAIPSDVLIETEAAVANNATFDPWTGADLTSGAWDVSVVVWQWCRGVPERQGNLMALGDEWWCP